MFREREIDGIVKEVAQVIGRIEECQDKLDKTKIENLRICYGTGDGKDWGNYLFE
jgi:hypothetical protein